MAKTTDLLQTQQLWDKSMPGGMMGGYREPGFPFYFINQRMLEYLGYLSETEFVEKNQGFIEHCIHPDDRERVDLEVAKQLSSKEEYEVDYRMEKKDGSFIWVHDIGRAIIAEDGREAITSICLDITKEHILQEKLQKSNQGFVDLMHHMAAGISVTEYDQDLHGKITYLSDTFLEMCEADYDAVVKRYEEDPMYGICEEDVEAFTQHYLAVLKNGGKDQINYRYLTFKNHIVYIQAHFSAIKHDDGTVTLYFTCADITEIMEMEKRQQARIDLERKKMLSGDKFLTAYSIMNLRTMKIVECRDYQWESEIAPEDTLDAALEKVARSVFLEEDAIRFRKNHDLNFIQENYKKGISTWEGDYRFKNASGDMYWQRNIVNLLNDPNTGDLFLYDYLYDIMADKIMEEFVEGAVKSEFELIGVLAMDSRKLYELVFDGGTTRVITEEYEVIRHKYVQEHVILEDREFVLSKNTIENIKRQLSFHPSGYSFEHRTCRKDGTIAYLEVCYYKLKNSDNICFCNVRDITATIRKETEKNKELENALNAAEAATKAKTDFLARMSHDMRTPMNAIIGLSALTLDDAKDPMAVRENMTKMRASSDFLLGLVNDILDMAKIEDGSVVLKPEPYTYAEFLANMKTMFQPQCDAKGITLIIKEPQMNPMIWIDKMRINQVFFNVFSNAVKFTPPGGTIRYTVENLAFYDDKLTVDYIISDTGIGMSKEYQKHLFEPFAQESNDITSELQGSGLGLSITKQLVDLMNGTIQITSKQGVGTTVRICFVMKCLEKDHKETPKQNRVDVEMNVLNGKHILLVEDHPLNAQIAIKILEKKNMVVTHAENGRIAVEMFQSSKPGELDSILMDIRMPEMSGLDATRAIRALNRPDAKEIPIIAMSANAYPEDVQKSLDAGMNDHLAKPVEPRKLYQTLAKYQ